MKYILLALTLSITQTVSSQISFIDKTSFAGLGGSALNQGLALGDYDNDGREDLYVSALNGGPNRLYRNMGNFIFEDVSTQAGVNYAGTSKVSSWGDIDNDGDPDLYIGNRDEDDVLYINQGDGTFTEETTARGIYNPAPTSAVLFSDINRDGWLDIYIGNMHQPNIMYLNDGTGHFTDHAEASGATDDAVAMGSVFFDFDLDGDEDLYLPHDAQVPYILYRNDGNVQFTNISSEANVNYAGFGMGAEVGDFNQDGYMDIYITNLYDNVLYQNMGDGTFESVGEAMHVNDQGMGWGSVFADFDNDRLQDIYVSNDFNFSPYENVLYHNIGNDFETVSEGDPCESPYAGYATVASDLNDDGLMDLLVANSGAPGVQLFQNVSTGSNHYIAFHFEGVQSNRDAIGARIEVHTAAGIQYDQVISSSGYAANNGRWIHFGLADQQSVDKVIIHWPSGVVEQIDNLDGDQKYRIREGEGVISKTIHPEDLRVSCNTLYADDDIFVVHPFGEDVDVRLFDVAGKAVSAKWETKNTEVHFQIDHLAPGLYIGVIRSAEGSCAAEVLVK